VVSVTDPYGRIVGVQDRCNIIIIMGRGIRVVKALGYKPEGFGFETR
jgi:hypothetical protein